MDKHTHKMLIGRKQETYENDTNNCFPLNLDLRNNKKNITTRKTKETQEQGGCQ